MKKWSFSQETRQARLFWSLKSEEEYQNFYMKFIFYEFFCHVGRELEQSNVT
jgi:hypothetical protein